uniref:Uncharacterized protein n=1 Tax=Rhizophora mucronata TaxID=61149 RepID=A0A2P2Q4C2_RHIMU
MHLIVGEAVRLQ